jgi:superfamily II DNA or RNA helicase
MSSFAHGPLTKENKKFFPQGYKNPDNGELVAKFNNYEIPILVGTSCISMGTDVRAVKTMIYLQGGMSPINVPQAVGRTTRKIPGKDHCTIIDFNISNVEMLARHTHQRARMYEIIYPDVEFL